jgi:LPXTG-motif cell wall-anchored protein
MPNTGADFVPMIYLAGMSIKLGGALVVAGRKKSPTS